MSQILPYETRSTIPFVLMTDMQHKPGRQMTEPISVPATLIESMRNQRVVLFLGAGASMESVNTEGERPPSADQLRQLLGQKFFGQPMDGYDLTFLNCLT